ncbi:MAG: T9SS type A sorting domain-containing protein [Bacteroidales bacterium]|jgi:hypothetical protein|nr:T9SS type A sorting domain-containing protein [Bacteroidales bacterium]
MKRALKITVCFAVALLLLTNRMQAATLSNGIFSTSETVVTLYNSGTFTITYDPNGNELANNYAIYLHIWYKYKWCDNQGAGEQSVDIGSWGENRHIMTKGTDNKFHLTINGTLADYFNSNGVNIGSIGASGCPEWLSFIAHDASNESQEGGIKVSNYASLYFWMDDAMASHKKDDIYYFYQGETLKWNVQKELQWNGGNYASDEQKMTVQLKTSDGVVLDSIPKTEIFGDGLYLKNLVLTTQVGENLIVRAVSTNGLSMTSDNTDILTIAAPVVTLSADSSSLTEGNSTKVTAKIPIPASATLTVTLSGTDDFTGTATITIPAGDTTAYTTLTATDDHAKAGNKSATVGITSVTGLSGVTFTSAGSINVTIIDKDANCSNPIEPVAAAVPVCKGSTSATITVSNHAGYTNPVYSLWTAASDGTQVGSDNTTGSITVSETFDAQKTYYLQVEEIGASTGCNISDRTVVAVGIKESPSDFEHSVTNATNGVDDGAITFTAGEKGIKPFSISLTSTTKGISLTGFISGANNDTTFDNLPAAVDYEAAITGADGCGNFTISNIEIQELACTPPSNPAIDGGAQSICKGTPATLTIASLVAGVTYNLLNAVDAIVATAQTGVITVPNTLPVGTYKLQGTGYTGDGVCEESAKVNILTIKTLPYEATATVIQGSSPTADLGKISVTTGSKGGSPFAVRLLGDNSVDITETGVASNHTFEQLPAGDYTVTVTANNGCDTVLTNLTITNCAPPAIPTVNDTAACAGTAASLVISGYNDVLYTYALYNEAGTSIIGTATYSEGVITTPAVNAEIKYNVRATLKATALEGCQYSQKEVTVKPNSLPVLTLTPSAVTCVAEGSIDVAVSGGLPFAGAKYLMQNVGYSSQTKEISGFDYTALVAGNYTVTVTDSNGCSATDNTEVTANYAKPTINAAPSPATAQNNDGSIYVTVTGGTQIFLNGGDPQTAPYTYQNLSSGIYRVSAIHSVTGCKDSVEVTVGTNSPVYTTAPAWQVHGDSIVITFNTASSNVANQNLKFYNNDDIYIWGGVVFQDNSDKYITGGWNDIPDVKFKMTRTSDYNYRYVITDMQTFYGLTGEEYANVKGFKWLFRTGGDGAGGNILEEKNNGNDFWEDIHTFAVKLWPDTYGHTNKDGYNQFYRGEKIKLYVEKYIDGGLNDGKKYPVSVKIGATFLVELGREVVYNGEAVGKLDTLVTLSALVKDVISATGYSEGGAVAHSNETLIEVIDPVITFSQSTTTVNETTSNVDTVWAKIPAKYGSAITIPVSVSGSTYFNLSADEITIAAGQTSGYIILTIVSDGLYTSRSSLTITAGSVSSPFTVSGSPLILNVENSEVPPVPNITSFTPLNGENRMKDVQISISATAENTDSMYLFINGVTVLKVEDDEISYNYTPDVAKKDTFTVWAINVYDTAIKQHIVTVTDCEPNPAPEISAINAVSYSGTTATFTITNYSSNEVYSLWTLEEDGLEVNMIGDGAAKTVTSVFTKDTSFYLQAFDNSKIGECQYSARVEVAINVLDAPAFVSTYPAGEISMKKDSLLVTSATGNSTVDSMFIYIDDALVARVKAGIVNYNFTPAATGSYAVRFVAQNDVLYEAEYSVTVNVFDPYATVVDISGGLDVAVLSDSVKITLDVTGMGLTAGEAIYLHPFYKYKQNAGDNNDQTIAPCGWMGKCYPMTYSNGIYTFQTTALRSFFNLGWEGDRPVGMGFIFYNEDGTKEIKNNSEDFWLPLKTDYAVKIWIYNQEDHKVQDTYNYYVGEDIKLKVEKYLKYNTMESLDIDNIKKYPVYVGGYTDTIEADAAYSGGAFYLTKNVTAAESAVITARGVTNVSSRVAEQYFKIKGINPVITLTQSTDSISETWGIDTVWATIPVAFSEDIKVSVNVTGSHFNISYDTITIFAGLTSGYVLINALPDGSKEEREPLVISADVVAGTSVAFTVVGSPLTLKVGDTEKGVAVGDISAATALNLYPNPVVHGILTIESNLPAGTSYSIVSMQGKRLLEGRTKSTKTEINVTSLPSGVYLLNLSGTTHKFIIR